MSQLLSLSRPKSDQTYRANHNELAVRLNESDELIVIDDQGDQVQNLSALDLSFEITAAAEAANARNVTVTLVDSNGDAYPVSGALLRARICNDGTSHAVASNATIIAGDGCTTVDAINGTHPNTKDIVITNATATASTGTLTISGVVVDGETVTIGSRVYQFRTGATALTSGNVAVDVSARGTKAQGILTIAEPVTAGDTIIIGTQTYVFVTGATNAPGEIGIGGSEAATKLAIPLAINGGDGFNVANTTVTAASAFSADILTLTARFTGTQGNSIVTAELGQGLTHASNVFNNSTLGTTTAGVDVSAANAGADLVTAINADASAIVSASGTGTVTITADTAGNAGDSIVSTETMANGAFGAATLTGGANGSLAVFNLIVTDASVETVTLRLGPPPLGLNYRADFSAILDLAFA
jgi:hypothetical protein